MPDRAWENILPIGTLVRITSARSDMRAWVGLEGRIVDINSVGDAMDNSGRVRIQPLTPRPDADNGNGPFTWPSIQVNVISNPDLTNLQAVIAWLDKE